MGVLLLVQLALKETSAMSVAFKPPVGKHVPHANVMNVLSGAVEPMY
jgi:hypothetical protein